MKRYFKTRKIIPALFVMAAFAWFAVAPGFALDIEEAKNPVIKEIPGLGSGGDRDFAQEVADQYDFIGTVDDVQEEGIVAGDSYMKISPKAKVSGARTGARVGIVLNDAGEVVLCEPFKKPVGK